MASMYDEYWTKRTADIVALFERADHVGVSESYNVSDIVHLGQRASWYGLAIIKGNRTANRKPMAHLRSLANIIKSKKINRRSDTYYKLKISNDLLLTVSKMKWKAHEQAGNISFEEVAILEELLPILFLRIEDSGNLDFYDYEVGKWINANISFLRTYTEDRGKKALQERFPDQHILNIRNCLYHLSNPSSYWIETIDAPHKKIIPLKKLADTHYELKTDWRKILGVTGEIAPITDVQGNTVQSTMQAGGQARVAAKRGARINELAALLGNSREFDPTSEIDAREKVERSIAVRRGQAAFRSDLIAIYGGKCAITGCDALPALEAAHIAPFRGEQWNHSSNGILLRGDIHTLFDLHLIAIDPETLDVIIASPLNGTHYEVELRNRKAALEHGGKLVVNREVLAAHCAKLGK